MKSQEELQSHLDSLIRYCQSRPIENGTRGWMEGQIVMLLWVLGSPAAVAIEKSHEITNPVKAVCPPPMV